MDLELTPGWMLAGFLVSTVGFGLFVYGKKQLRFPQLIAGIALMVYPGFIESPAVMLAVGGAMVGAMWIAVRAGA